MLGVAQGLVFFFQLLQFLLAQRQRFQLLELVAEQLVAGALFVAAAGHPFQLLAGLPPALRGEQYLTGQLAGAGIGIQQAAVGIGLEQRLVFVLAVDVDQQFAERLEVALRTRRAIDVGARATFSGDDPAQDARAVLLQVALAQPGLGFGNLRDVEAGENVRLVGTGAYHAAVGAIAQRQAERVEHDRLAGTGFAGDDAHAAAQFQIQLIDDGVVANGQMDQHGRLPRFARLAIYTVVGESPSSISPRPLEEGFTVPI